MGVEGAASISTEDGGRARQQLALPLVLVLGALVGWWWSIRMADDMRGGMSEGMGGMSMGATVDHSLTFAGFVVAWVAMMAAMMFPAISPVVRLYQLAAAKGRAAPLPFFVGAYLTVWGTLAVPAYVAWRALDEPIADGATWAARLAGGVLVAAGVWQLTPLKSVCLRHCRSPLSFFLQYGRGARTPLGAFRMGAAHGAFCVGCCWALMAVLVALGTMNLLWMAILAGLIFLEKNAPHGERIARLGATALAIAGVALLADPDLLTAMT